jgi:hypothetical protein
MMPATNMLVSAAHNGMTTIGMITRIAAGSRFSMMNTNARSTSTPPTRIRAGGRRRIRPDRADDLSFPAADSVIADSPPRETCVSPGLRSTTSGQKSRETGRRWTSPVPSSSCRPWFDRGETASPPLAEYESSFSCDPRSRDRRCSESHVPGITISITCQEIVVLAVLDLPYWRDVNCSSVGPITPDPVVSVDRMCSSLRSRSVRLGC